MINKIIPLAARVFGFIVYLSLVTLSIVRLVTGNGDWIVPLVGIILISGFATLFGLVINMTQAVKTLVETTNEEIGLLLNLSSANSLAGHIQQRDDLN